LNRLPKVIAVSPSKFPSFIALRALALLLLPALAAAQTNGRNIAAQEVRVGAVRSIDSPDVLTDGGLRTVLPGNVYAVPAAITREYRLSANDLFEVEVLDAENLKRTVRVNGGGSITMPLIGHVHVAGLTVEEAEQRIASRYAERYFQNPEIAITLKEFTTDRITVDGQVGRPGIFPLTGQMTLLRVLAVAGGFGPIADRSHVMVYRVNDHSKRESLIYDVDKIRAGEAEDPPVRGDDVIVVQRDSTRALLKDSLLRDVIDSINPFSMLVPH
jgi:polysaccharide export outer membrane protein